MEAHIRDEIAHIIPPAAEPEIDIDQARKPAHTSTCTLASTLAHARFYNGTKAELEEKPYLFCKGMLKDLDNDNRHVVA